MVGKSNWISQPGRPRSRCEADIKRSLQIIKLENEDSILHAKDRDQ